MAQTVIEFFYDSISPYSYLASTQVDALAARQNAVVWWRPYFLGKVMEATGNRPPLTVPAKGKYMFKDLQLWSRYYGVPVQMPANFPASTVSAQRIGCALAAPRAGDWAKAISHAYWGLGRDISQLDVLKAVAIQLGWEGDEILALAQDPTAKEQLKLNTEEAVQRGAFGAPALFVGDTLFWGNDRLPLLEAFLAGKL